MDRARDFQETRGNSVFLNDEKIGSVLFIDNLIFMEEEQEYMVTFHFVDQAQGKPVEVTELLSCINATWLHKTMVGSGGSNINAKKEYQYFSLKVEGTISGKGLPCHHNWGEIQYGKEHPIHTVPRPPLEILKRYCSLGWKNWKEGFVFLGATKYTEGGAQDSKSEYAGEYSVAPTGSFEIYKKMLAQEVIGNIPLEGILAIGASATVLEFANLKWDANLLNPLVHIYNDTTSGKSTAGFLMVSMGSSPVKKADNTLFMDFNATNNALMQMIGENTGFPLGIDEFSMNREKDITETIYALADGKEKRRYRKGGHNSSNSSAFSTTILMNGEDSILSHCDAKGGLRVRLFEIGGVIWTSSASSANHIVEVCGKNYGFVTPLIAQKLLRETDCFWKLRLDRWKNLILKKARREGFYVEVTERISKTVALFMVSAELFCQVLDMQLSIKKVFEFFYTHIIEAAAGEVNIGIRAYNYLRTYFAQNKSAFTVDAWNLNFTSISPLNVEGVVYTAKSPKTLNGIVYNRLICFTIDKTKEILEKGGFHSVDVCMKSIRDKELLMTKDKKRLTGDFRMNNEKVTGYKIWIPEESYFETED